MLIEIRKHTSEYPEQKSELVLTVVQNPALLTCLAIVLVLLACETYYTNKASAEPHTIFIGGAFSLVGFILVLGAVVRETRKRKRYRQHMAANGEYYVVLNDSGCERGVKGSWSESRNWRLLTRHTENEKIFSLHFGAHEIPIFKYEFKESAQIDELRNFLKATPRG